MINTILFDLDGTLLPMDLEEFTHHYLNALCKKCAPMNRSKRLTESHLGIY
ncbi:hypothetical protein [Marinisporobacter balticus]|uniref:Haloacid dehalogenase-like hydrolase n=1 Tax=Marinisporobacter balticus TaxID=2018667 RepID=A0A4R2KZA9_9FIRM|nr:hypothetical protein [Marinisporobacter balticus]TCO80021.1 hypothetical protein EV214_101258 [Marinisporobacter balticus]